MFDNFLPDHHIQKHIISILMHKKYARFRDMRPKNVDTNLYSYHLKKLIKRRFVSKQAEGYTLNEIGLLYVDRVSTQTLKIRNQPKIITMLVIQNSDGKVLLYKRGRQPYIETWTLPYGKLHIDDKTILNAATREASEKLNLNDIGLEHAGDCYIRAKSADEIVISTLCHVFRGYCDDIEPNDSIIWAKPHKLDKIKLAPAVEEIITRTFFKDPYFFEEYESALLE